MSTSSNVSGRTIVPFGGSGDQTFFLGEMYNTEGIVNGTGLHCLDESDDAPFNVCGLPPIQRSIGVFWD